MSSSLESPIINFRKMKQDFAQSILRDGKELFEKKVVTSAKVVALGGKTVKVHAQVAGAFSNTYECALEIDITESQILDASCDCPHNFDCQHLAGVLYYLEEEIERLLVDFGKDKKIHEKGLIKQEPLQEVFRTAEKKVIEKQERELERFLLQEYMAASQTLGKSCFFIPDEELGKDSGELIFLFAPAEGSTNRYVDMQIILRLPFRSKPFYIQQPRQFLSAIHAQEPFIIGQNRYVFGLDSFGPFSEELLKCLRQHMHVAEVKGEKLQKIAFLDREGFGEFLASAFDFSMKYKTIQRHLDNGLCFSLPNIYWLNSDTPLVFSDSVAQLGFTFALIKEPKLHLVLSQKVQLPGKSQADTPTSISIFECSRPGVFADGAYYRLPAQIKRQHVHELSHIEKMAIPEALFGSFIENCLPELHRFAKIENPELLEQIVTYPFHDDVKAVCDLSYASGELEAKLFFSYGNIKIPEATSQFTLEDMKNFVSKEGILARNLSEENALVRDLFKGFLKEEKMGSYIAKNEKKIVEFMTEVIPKNRNRVEFSCPESLLGQFCYDDTKLHVSLKEGQSFDKIDVEIEVDGMLSGISSNHLWDLVVTKKPYVVVSRKGGKFLRQESDDEMLQPTQKILILKLDIWGALLQVFDELEFSHIESKIVEKPLWLLMNFSKERFEHLPVTYSISKKLQLIQDQLVNMQNIAAPEIPKEIQADLRSYQNEGVDWLSRLRMMGLNGILADDMGLGKTLQAICAITQYKNNRLNNPDRELIPSIALIICPTSLVDNWKEEIVRFNPNLSVATCVGTPAERKRIISTSKQLDVLITSYGLVQKDIELYEKATFSYLILDEAQYIKNRETRNARSVKKIPARHRLILTGTPLENSLADLWSLFDFLMPGFIGSFERFSENYIRPTGSDLSENLKLLKKKIAPFVMRRLKQDVLQDLPPIAHIVYHCHLTAQQEELYNSYAKSAREELTKLVEKEGYEKVQIHVLATLTRLKQICCHPAIFAKDAVVSGDSAKYEMFLDLMGSLIESKRKTVVFSQYTSMLAIMKEDLRKMGAELAYLDGATKNRMSVVRQFNEDPNIQVFLVSLKAGGNGLNLVGADTVIHFDMWWNPAVEDQATSRVWRLGQKQKVSSYKLITKGTIEEKIIELQERKKELLKDIVCTDEEVVSKLSWDEVIQLLRTDVVKK